MPNHAINSDAEAIAALVNGAYRPGSGVTGWTHESDLVAGNRTSATQIFEILSRHHSVILVGLNNEAIVACAHIEKDGNSSHIGMLAVNPILQGAGVGKLMLAEVEKYANSVFGSGKLVMVVVSERTELISFYLRRGYQKTGLVLDYPISAGAGIPKSPGMKIETLVKQLNSVAERERA